MRSTFAAVLLVLLLAAAPRAQSRTHKVTLESPESLASLVWTTIAADPQGDRLRARLPDAKELSYALDPNGDVIWFRVSVYDPLPERWFGMSVVIDNDAQPDNGMVWWGTNKIKFDRLAGAYFSKAVDEWQGYSGVADSDAVAHGSMNNLGDVRVALDRDHRAILMGVPRSTLGSATTFRVIAAVGSMIANNDDVPNEGMITVALRPAGGR